MSAAKMPGPFADGIVTAGAINVAMPRTIHAPRRPLRTPQCSSTAGVKPNSGVSSIRAAKIPYPARLRTTLPNSRGAATATGSLWSVSVIGIRLIGRERPKRHGAGALDGVLQLALMQRAGAGDAAGKDLAALRDELLQHLHVLVVDVLELLDAELADALPAIEEFLFAALLRAGGATPLRPSRCKCSHCFFPLLLGPRRLA